MELPIAATVGIVSFALFLGASVAEYFFATRLRRFRTDLDPEADSWGAAFPGFLILDHTKYTPEGKGKLRGLYTLMALRIATLVVAVVSLILVL